MSVTAPLHSKDFNPFGELIGLKISKIEEGQCHCQIEVTKDHHNPYSVVHGGVVYSLADTGMGGALFSSLDSGERCATLEIKISYFQFVISGTLSCESKVIHKSRRFGFMESKIFNDDRLVAEATGTFSILGAKGKQRS